MTTYPASPATPCREWQGPRKPDGYGRRRRRGEPDEAAHRWVVRVAGVDKYGTAWDESLIVMHECDNPPCFRWDHLRLGTRAENSHDMVAKQRQCRGTQTHSARLNEDDVRIIRSRLAGGELQSELAAEFRVDCSLISLIGSRKRWSHVR